MKKYISFMVLSLMFALPIYAQTPQEQYVSLLQQVIALLEQQIQVLTTQLEQIRINPNLSIATSTPNFGSAIAISLPINSSIMNKEDSKFNRLLLTAPKITGVSFQRSGAITDWGNTTVVFDGKVIMDGTGRNAISYSTPDGLSFDIHTRDGFYVGNLTSNTTYNYQIIDGNDTINGSFTTLKEQ